MSVQAKMTAIADAIREKTAKTEALTLDEMAAGVDTVFKAGEEKGIQDFWDAYLQKGTATTFSRAFGGYLWTTAILKTIPYTLKIGNGNDMFRYSNIEDLSFLDVDTSGLYNVRGMFSDNSHLRAVFPLDFSNVITELSSTFIALPALEEVTFTEGSIKATIPIKDSPRLSKSSIISIINGLSGDASGKTLTLSVTAVNTAFETTAGTADGSASQEWADLIATKANWTISLV